MVAQARSSSAVRGDRPDGAPPDPGPRHRHRHPCAAGAVRGIRGDSPGHLREAAPPPELAVGDGPGRIYCVEPTGTLENDPDLTEKRFPSNPTRSYRTQQPLRVVGEVVDWEGHSQSAA